MAGEYSNEPMIDMFIFETNQLVEQLENTLLDSEKTSCFSPIAINEIFRIMHTIKGSAAMMLFNNVSALAHSIEDVFYFLREEKPTNVDCSKLTDMVLEGIDFIKNEIEKLKAGIQPNGDETGLTLIIKEFLAGLKNSQITIEKAGEKEVQPDEEKVSSPKQQFYISSLKVKKKMFRAVIFFEDGCEMENIRAYGLIHQLKGIAEDIAFIPRDIIDNDDTVNQIRANGFGILFKTSQSYDEIYTFINRTLFLKDVELEEVSDAEEFEDFEGEEEKQIVLPQITMVEKKESGSEQRQQPVSNQKIISVNVDKLDMLLDLVGELVIAEAMVTQNPDLRGYNFENFHKSARQLKKITNELQDTVMSLRMVPIAVTFQKMHRVVRDMCKKLNKEVDLEIIGEGTEVDKNIIEHISDPLMHLIRNAIDHGIEDAAERNSEGKSSKGRITLEARSAGRDVLILVKDDGRGLNKSKIYQKALDNGLVQKPEAELTEKEIFSLIFLPGFSTKEKVTEFSGRGVGMDVVTKNIETVGGSVSVESKPGEGSTIWIRIPLTLAIIDGMTIGVGASRYTLPITVIKESFKAKDDDVIIDPDGNEMILIRGKCYPILRLHEHFNTKTEINAVNDGIMVMVENEAGGICIFADELIGEQQVVVKALPKYIKKIRGLAGCTLLGDGNISLILDVANLTA